MQCPTERTARRYHRDAPTAEARNGTCVECMARHVHPERGLRVPGLYGLHCESPISDICRPTTATRNIPQLPANLSNSTFSRARRTARVLDRIDCSKRHLPGHRLSTTRTSVGSVRPRAARWYGWSGTDCSAVRTRTSTDVTTPTCANGG